LKRRTPALRFLAALLFLPPLATPSSAKLDIDDGGPVLHAGRFSMRVTNAGIVGNAFFDQGLSDDPSFEYPSGSGVELLGRAELWVGALDASGIPRVSGGPMLEWRPTPAPEDTVLEAWNGRLGSRQGIDDDGDGRVDEERLNGRDDDGDGEADEDLGLAAQQLLAADYVDDRPEAVAYLYPNGEPHRPLELSVHQEAMAWGTPGFDGIAGLDFTIRNHGGRTLEDVYIGVLVDLDVHRRADPAGRSNDRPQGVPYDRSVLDGRHYVRTYDLQTPVDTTQSAGATTCVTRLAQTVIALTDAAASADPMPGIAIVPLEHSIDPLAFVRPEFASGPDLVSFRTTVFTALGNPGRGGPPVLDAQRYEALAGRLPATTRTAPDDYVVLVSCGPFRRLAPNQTLRFALALVAGPIDSLANVAANAAVLHHGRTINALPDTLGPRQYDFDVGETGRNGHEVCLEPPPGVSFVHESHCAIKFANDDNPDGPATVPVLYEPGRCVWTDADCDVCTGINGNETRVPWVDARALPPMPRVTMTAGDHEVRIAWDNISEILLAAGLVGRPGYRFAGYNVYKLSDWRTSVSPIAPSDAWALAQRFSTDPSDGGVPLAAITDTTLDYERILFERRLYPAGRYVMVDREVLNGFDYAYSVAAVFEYPLVFGNGSTRMVRIESPLSGNYDRALSPAAATRGNGPVWVVPNPYRGEAGWDRPQLLGRGPSTHVDFMGLPPERCSIKVWTLAGDLVAQIEHDGTRGDGQAAWNLVSRNGQDVTSGVYLFTVDGRSSKSMGRFVVVR
jgi:hypothetical protein